MRSIGSKAYFVVDVLVPLFLRSSMMWSNPSYTFRSITVPAPAWPTGGTAGMIRGVRKPALVIGLLVALAACASCAEVPRNKTYQVGSPSMEPTIAEGSTITAEVLEPGGYQPRRGDIVVFDVPDTWDAEGQDQPRVYRVAAVPGDTISCCDPQGRIVRNGTAVDEPYLARTGATPAEIQPFTVPADELYLLGDNRGVANDSAQLGPVPVTNVIGVVKR
ncbi:signal peptidase I [Micromonospora saelicesensis]|uniref:signal peptidase I n=1 Tax=Micromonospora saelicesensis TaxID=285676 RepID=UPI0011BFCDCA|nr:signal peptidase I [Micromonospora saelicesensis]